MTTAALFETPEAPPVIDTACPFPGRWSLVCTFFAAGTPGPGGSKRAQTYRRKDGSLVTRANGTPVVGMIDAGGDRTKLWRAVVAHEARIAHRGAPVDAPIGIVIDFVFAHLKAHKRSNGTVKPYAPLYHTNQPDVLKCARSTEDALSGIVYADDKLICHEHLSKRYGSESGAQITLWRLECA